MDSKRFLNKQAGRCGTHIEVFNQRWIYWIKGSTVTQFLLVIILLYLFNGRT